MPGSTHEQPPALRHVLRVVAANCTHFPPADCLASVQEQVCKENSSLGHHTTLNFLPAKQLGNCMCPPLMNSPVCWSSVQSTPRSRCGVLSLRTMMMKYTDLPLISVHPSSMMVMLNWELHSRRFLRQARTRLLSACSRLVRNAVAPEHTDDGILSAPHTLVQERASQALGWVCHAVCSQVKTLDSTHLVAHTLATAPGPGTKSSSAVQLQTAHCIGP